jgi:zinc transport system substrate-binding protein
MRNKMKNFLKFIFTGFLLMAGFTYGQDLAATTSVLSSIIRDIGGEKIRVVTLVPPGSCPGHFDLKAGDLKVIEKSGILFAHGFEEYLGIIISSVNNPDFKPLTVEIKGSWFIPHNQKEAYRRISGILSSRFPQHSDFFEQNRKKAEEEINKVDNQLKKLFDDKKLNGIPVICNSHIAEMIAYMGFDVAATYGRKEELTAVDIKNLIKLCRERKVRIIIDNLQAGSDTGRVIADELNLPHLAISNFPGVFPKTPTLRQTLYENANRILTVYENSKNTAD